jgi:hypothetical protein
MAAVQTSGHLAHALHSNCDEEDLPTNHWEAISSLNKEKDILML